MHMLIFDYIHRRPFSFSDPTQKNPIPPTTHLPTRLSSQYSDVKSTPCWGKTKMVDKGGPRQAGQHQNLSLGCAHTMLCLMPVR